MHRKKKTNGKVKQVKRMATPPPPWTRAAIAERLELTRQALGLSQAEFCRRVGLAPTTYNNYKQLVREIPHQTAVKLAETFGLSLDWIYRGQMDALSGVLQTKINQLRTKPAPER